MRVERCDAPGAEWDAFAESRPGATLAHAAAWARVLPRAYGIEPCHLAARRESGELCGILPLMRVRTLRGRIELVSMPYLDSGGILADDAQVTSALLDAALAAARGSGAHAVELRHLHPPAGFEAPGGDRVDLALELAPSEDAQWRALPATVRNQTRKAEREGLRLGEGERASWRAFCGPYEVNMRDLGSPPHARGFFRAASEAFAERLRFVVTVDGERPVGGLVAIHYAGSVSVPWAATLRAERRRCPNNLIYWEALRWAVSVGARELDFGRSPRESGTHHFKRGWGAQERPLHWRRLAPGGEPLPASSPQDSGLLRSLSGLWSRLPVAFASRVGPRVRPFLTS
jgi:FemAB-related protein (PEP-CTERM system-associated)